MDTEGIFYKCAALTLEVCLSYVLYKQYRKHAECLTSLQEAQCLELNDELKKTLEENNGIIKYAAISGKIQALTAPLTSRYLPKLRGVIHEKTTSEYEVGCEKNEKIVEAAVNCVPFALCGKANSFFAKKVSVEVIEPLTAEELVIPTAYDEFSYSCNSLGDFLYHTFLGKKVIKIHETGKMLCEKETLTAVGKLTIENNGLKIKPPDEVLTYFLTPLSLEALISKVKCTTETYKALTIIMSTVSAALFLYLSRCAFIKIKQRVIHNRRRKEYFETLRRLQTQTVGNSTEVHDNVPKCIVCAHNPVGIIILNCGHVCLCSDCSKLIKGLCPMCRRQISKKISAFFP